MSYCNNCKGLLIEDSNFCPNCGMGQNKSAKSNDFDKHILTAMCIATIIGSIFTVCRALIYELVVSLFDSEYYRGAIYAVTSTGTLIGAIIMIMRKKVGLYIYSFFQIIYIITVVVAILDHSSGRSGAIIENFAFGMIFLIPSLLFLIVYWTKFIRKQLV